MVPVEQLNIFKQSARHVRAETRVTVIDKVRKLPASPGQNFTKAIRSVCVHTLGRGATPKNPGWWRRRAITLGRVVHPGLHSWWPVAHPRNNRCQPYRKLFLNCQRLAWGCWKCAGGDATGPRGGGARARGGAVQVGGPGPGEEAGHIKCSPPPRRCSLVEPEPRGGTSKVPVAAWARRSLSPRGRGFLKTRPASIYPLLDQRARRPRRTPSMWGRGLPGWEEWGRGSPLLWGSGVRSAGRIGSKFCQLWVSWLWLLVGVFAPGVLWTWVAEAESTLLENECLSLFAPGTLGILGAPALLACFCKSVLLASFF